MALQLNISSSVFLKVVSPLVFGIGITLTGMGISLAAQPGHGRVISVAGSPLQVSIPLSGLTADDLKVLNASVAETGAWAQAGLSLPASIDSLSVNVEPGANSSSRNLVMRSTQVVNRPVIDVLIRLTTASGITSIQSSYLVLTSEASPQTASSVRVARGDTLYEIALAKAVSGADIYQVMWAIYKANTQAFISNNMNLLRAGVTLNIPDAAAMRAVDRNYARAMFAKHDQAFRARRGAGQAGIVVPIVVSETPLASSVSVSPSQPSASANSTVEALSGDQVRLASSNPSDQLADLRVANANELREMQAQVESLQKNVEELKEALQKSQSASGTVRTTGSKGATGASGSTGSTGATGSTSSVGSVEPSGPATTPGTSVAPGSSLALGASSQSDSAASSTISALKDTGVAAAAEVKTGIAKVKQLASDHVLGFVLGLSALLALIIAFLLKSAGTKANADERDPEAAPSPAMASDFDQKLQSIDLNLSNDDKPTPSVGSTKTGV